MRRRLALAYALVTAGALLVVGLVETVIERPPAQPAAVLALLRELTVDAAVTGLLALAVGWCFGLVVARGLTRRLARLSAAADAWGRGDFGAAVGDTAVDELGQLARRLDAMAEQLRDLLRLRQELAAAEERNRLALDLHDAVKQHLFAASMQLGAARARLGGDRPDVAAPLAEAERLTRAAQHELTATISELRPAALVGAGLAPALNDLAEGWSRQTDIAVEIRCQGEGPLPLAAEHALYRVAQEALANAGRHSGAAKVALLARWEAKGVRLVVEDDGRGFDRDAPRKGLGLTGMRERVEALGGSLAIATSPGGGTRLEAWVPSGPTNGGNEPAPRKALGHPSARAAREWRER